MFGQVHALVDGSAYRHPVQKINLVHAQAQNIPGLRFQGSQRPAHKMFQDPVQGSQGFHGAVYQLRDETPVQIA